MRMSVNPQPIIQRLELGTSSLQGRIQALRQMHAAGYKVGLLIAPVVLLDNWKELYAQLIEQLADELSDELKRDLFIEIIFMTYSYIHRVINAEAFPRAVQLYDKSLMTGRGRGKYCYNSDIRQQAEAYLREILAQKLNGIPIIYVV